MAPAANAAADDGGLDGRYAPFVRSDAYGCMGTGPLPLWRQVALAVASVTLLPVRTALVLLLLAALYIVCKACTVGNAAFARDAPANARRELAGARGALVRCAAQAAARAALFVMGFHVIRVTRLQPADLRDRHGGLGLGDHTLPERSPQKGGERLYRACAVVSNHVSWVDILYHVSATPGVGFVAKVPLTGLNATLDIQFVALIVESVTRLPMVGLISKCIGCIYVDREGKAAGPGATGGVSALVVERVQAALHIPRANLTLLFPEGTTTNGAYLLPFKTGAFVGHAPVQPMLLKYPCRSMSPAWESISGKRHIYLLLCQAYHLLEVTVFPVYSPTAAERTDPKLYASNVRKLLAAQGKLELSDLTLQDKRDYHAALRSRDSAGT
eukprot:SM000135S27028  [mRNA]  locus=s135:320560:323246:+ [translate_table: standard]